MRDPRLVITQHRPWRDVLAALVALVLFAVAGYVVFVAGRDAGAWNLSAVETERGRLAGTERRLSGDNAVLREQLAVLERAAQIEREAYQGLEGHLRTLQAQITDLKEEVAFYRSLVSTGARSGLDVQSFDVTRRGSDGEYGYRLVLTGDMKSDKVIKGTIDVSVTGEQQGKVTRLSHAELMGADSDGISFELRYFQKISGQLVLPPDFIPRRVLVKVTAQGDKPARVEKAFDWSVPVG